MKTKRPLRLVLTHERFPPDYGGGGELVVLETARHLQARGHRVQVVTTGDPGLRTFDGITTCRLPIGRYRMNLAGRDIATAARDADLIHTFTYHAAYPAYRAGRALQKPVVCGVLALFGDVWRQMRGKVAGRAFQAMESFLLRLPFDARIYLSDASHEMARALRLDQPGDVVIEPGINLAEYRAAPDKSCVMFSGKLESRKGIDVVLAVAARLPDIPFRIMGWGERFAAVAAARSANVTVERFVNRADLAAALSRARVFLFPTKAETFGIAVVEAMASGCAIASTSTLPFEGIRIDATDVEATAAAVSTLWNDPERCRHMGAQNRQAAELYSWERHVDRLEALYARLLAQQLD